MGSPVSTTDLQELKKCYEASDKIIEILQANQSIQEQNNDIRNTYISDHSDWEKKKKRVTDLGNDWDSTLARRKREEEGKDYHQGCSVVGPANSGSCSGDFYENRRDCCHRDGLNTCWTERKVCRKHGHIIDRDVRNEIGARPVFTDPEPIDNTGKYTRIATQVVPKENICCPNILNIIGSTVTDSTIEQVNNCKGSAEAAIDEQQKKITQNAAAEAQSKLEQQNKLNQQAEAAKQQTAVIVNNTESDSLFTSFQNDPKMKFKIGIFILILFLCCSSISSAGGAIILV